MANTYHEEPLTVHNAPIAVGCYDCDWSDFAKTMDEARALMKQHNSECPKRTTT